MSNFTVNGVYTYTSSNIYSYLGRVPSSDTSLKNAFDEFGIRPTGSNEDLRRLKNAMYEDYSNQVQKQIENQNNEKVIPWASLCAQIGVRATGDYEKDYAAFNNAIQLLSQSAMDGQAMAYFAGVRSEAQRVFGSANQQEKPEQVPYYVYQAQILR